MTQQKAVVEKYTDGFRRGDLARIVACLTDDVVWALHGVKTLEGTAVSRWAAIRMTSCTPRCSRSRMDW